MMPSRKGILMDSTRANPIKLDVVARDIAPEVNCAVATLSQDAEALAQAKASVELWEQRHGSFRAKVRPRYSSGRPFKR
jgi:hypothetical protein